MECGIINIITQPIVPDAISLKLLHFLFFFNDNNMIFALNATRIYLLEVILLYRVHLKKTPIKDMCDSLTLKMLPLALALIKTNNRHLFDPLVKN